MDNPACRLRRVKVCIDVCVLQGTGSKRQQTRARCSRLLALPAQCDNQRPFCRKCLNGGRQCAGYQRETVFIVGTIQDQGRCSSHPPRVLKTKTKTKPKTERKEKTAAPKSDDALALVPTEPLRPVWDDGGDGGGGGSVSVSCRGRVCRLRIAALRTNLQATTTTNARGDRGAADDGGGGKSVFVSLPPYEPPDLQPGGSEDDFRLTSRCFVHLAEPDRDRDGDRNGDRGSETGAMADGVCLFLYEVSCPPSHTGEREGGRGGGKGEVAGERLTD